MIYITLIIINIIKSSRFLYISLHIQYKAYSRDNTSLKIMLSITPHSTYIDMTLFQGYINLVRSEIDDQFHLTGI